MTALRDVPDGPAAPDQHLTGERLLAAGVIRQALLDAQSPSLPAGARAMAKGWLLRSDGLAFWCAVAGLELRIVRELAARVLADRSVPE